MKPLKLHREDLPPPPNSHREILQHSYSSGFKAAELKEFETLLGKYLCSKTSKADYQELKAGGKIDLNENDLSLMWVYAYKFDADGYLLSFKARLVARGDLQSTTEETYAATLAAQSFRAVIAISVAYKYKIRQYDIVAACTNASLPQAKVAQLSEGFRNHNSFLIIKKGFEWSA